MFRNNFRKMMHAPISENVFRMHHVRTLYLYLFRWCTSMISRLGELTALPAYLHISSYATLAMLSLEHPGRYRGIVELPSRAEFDTRCVLVCADCSRRQ